MDESFYSSDMEKLRSLVKSQNQSIESYLSVLSGTYNKDFCTEIIESIEAWLDTYHGAILNSSSTFHWVVHRSELRIKAVELVIEKLIYAAEYFERAIQNPKFYNQVKAFSALSMVKHSLANLLYFSLN